MLGSDRKSKHTVNNDDENGILAIKDRPRLLILRVTRLPQPNRQSQHHGRQDEGLCRRIQERRGRRRAKGTLARHQAGSRGGRARIRRIAVNVHRYVSLVATLVVWLGMRHIDDS